MVHGPHSKQQPTQATQSDQSGRGQAGIDRNSPVPLYYQISEIIKAEIGAGELKPGDLFTTEQALQDRFGVSRATARKAIEALEADGRLVRVVGKGTFVGAPELQIAQPHLSSFSEEIRQRGEEPGAKMLEWGTVQPPAHVAEHLHVAPAESVLQVKRLRTANDLPVLFVTHYFPQWLSLDGEVDFQDSLYNVLEQKFGIHLDEAVHSLEAEAADAEAARLLDVAVGTPVLRFERVVYDRQGKPIVYEEGCARPDRYRYQVRLKRR